jgi:RNA polymerase sigma-70 factor (ECF subfamily)
LLCFQLARVWPIVLYEVLQLLEELRSDAAHEELHQRPRFTATADQHRQLLSRFMQAVSTGQLDGLMQLLTEEVTLWVDGGGNVRGAATRLLHGHTAAAQFVLASIRYLPTDSRAEIAEVNGQLAAILHAASRSCL